jgi:hypothetical protein
MKIIVIKFLQKIFQQLANGLFYSGLEDLINVGTK